MADTAYRGCPLSRWSGRADRCRMCDRPLTGRQTLWCSKGCLYRYGRNHWWPEARSYRIGADGGRCVACGLSPGGVLAVATVTFWMADSAFNGPPPTRADTLRRLSPSVDAVDRLLSPAGRRPVDPIELVFWERRLTVDHVEPAHGRHGKPGCWNHQTNLRTLCHRCHVARTAEQRAAGELGRLVCQACHRRISPNHAALVHTDPNLAWHATGACRDHYRKATA